MAAIFQNGGNILPRTFLVVSIQLSFVGETLYGLKDNSISFQNIDIASSNTSQKSSYSLKRHGGYRK